MYFLISDRMMAASAQRKQVMTITASASSGFWTMRTARAMAIFRSPDDTETPNVFSTLSISSRETSG